MMFRSYNNILAVLQKNIRELDAGSDGTLKIDAVNASNWDELLYSKGEEVSAKMRDLNVILSLLATKGPQTIAEMSSNCIDDSHNWKSIFASRFENDMMGLVTYRQRKDSTYNKRYQLSYHGILFAMHRFRPQEETDANEQRTILDVLARNYHDVIPRIFGCWERLKMNSFVDVSVLFEIADPAKRQHNLTMFDDIFGNMPWGNDDYGNADMVAAAFYYINIKRLGQSDLLLSDIGLDEDTQEFCRLVCERVVKSIKRDLFASQDVLYGLHDKRMKLENSIEAYHNNDFWESRIVLADKIYQKLKQYNLRDIQIVSKYAASLGYSQNVGFCKNLVEGKIDVDKLIASNSKICKDRPKKTKRELCDIIVDKRVTEHKQRLEALKKQLDEFD